MAPAVQQRQPNQSQQGASGTIGGIGVECWGRSGGSLVTTQGLKYNIIGRMAPFIHLFIDLVEEP